MFGLSMSTALIILTVTAIGTSPAVGLELKKSDIEKAGHLFVWDIGTTPNVVDDKDDAIDFELECDSRQKTSEELKSLVAQRSLSLATDSSIKNVLNHLNLRSYNFSTSLIDAFDGDQNKPTFLIFPERHLNSDKSEKNIKLHEEKLNEMVRLTNTLLSMPVSIFNAIEGPRGYWSSVLNQHKTSAAEKTLLAAQIVRNKSLSGGDALAELYLDSIPSFYVDEPGMNVKWLVTSFAKNIKLSADFDAQKDNFPAVQKWFDQQGASSLIVKYSLKKYFDELMTKSPQDLVKESSSLCETRSKKFVENTFLELPAGDRQVVFLTIGSLHIHGVRKKLIDLNTSFIIFSPNNKIN